MQPAVELVIRHSSPATERELELARRLAVPLANEDELALMAPPFVLQFTADGLTLYQIAEGAPGGLCVDFDDPKLWRRSTDNLRQQNLCKAVGLKGKGEWRVLDAMAGLGKDAWLLASAGAQVTLLERSPVVLALLADAFSRRVANAAPGSPIHRMQLHGGDFLCYTAAESCYDVVYLDPMFPTAGRQARAKKDMYLLQSLLGENDCDESALLEHARALASSRVVVKRGKTSPALAGCKPDIVYKGSSNRYDVYQASMRSSMP